MASELLTISGLSAGTEDKPILHDIDLSVGAGETHVLMGPNGAGKSRSATSSWATRSTRSAREPSPSMART